MLWQSYENKRITENLLLPFIVSYSEYTRRVLLENLWKVTGVSFVPFSYCLVIFTVCIQMHVWMELSSLWPRSRTEFTEKKLFDCPSDLCLRGIKPILHITFLSDFHLGTVSAMEREFWKSSAWSGGFMLGGLNYLFVHLFSNGVILEAFGLFM